MKEHGIMTKHAGREYSNRMEQNTTVPSKTISYSRENSFQPVDEKFTRGNLEVIGFKAKAGFKK